MKSFKEYLNESLTNDDLVRARYFGKKAYSRRIENNPKKDVVFVNGFLNGMDVKTHSKLEKEYKKGYEEAKKDEDSSKLRATPTSPPGNSSSSEAITFSKPLTLSTPSAIADT